MKVISLNIPLQDKEWSCLLKVAETWKNADLHSFKMYFDVFILESNKYFFPVLEYLNYRIKFSTVFDDCLTKAI